MELIVEIGQNHNGDLDQAFELINQAKFSGASAVKFQVFNARELFPRENNPWYEYNCKTELTFDQLRRLADQCEKVDIEFLASAFDPIRVNWLEQVGVKRHKLASRSIYDQPLIDAMIATRKPIIASLGYWKETDFPKLSDTDQFRYLYCISKYPTELSEVNFNQINFERYWGFSDHTVGNVAAVVAFSRGARLVEKHFTLDKSLYGPDHACSMIPSELRQLVDFMNQARHCLE